MLIITVIDLWPSAGLKDAARHLTVKIWALTSAT